MLDHFSAAGVWGQQLKGRIYIYLNDAYILYTDSTAVTFSWSVFSDVTVLVQNILKIKPWKIIFWFEMTENIVTLINSLKFLDEHELRRWYREYEAGALA